VDVNSSNIRGKEIYLFVSNPRSLGSWHFFASPASPNCTADQAGCGESNPEILTSFGLLRRVTYKQV
jgi:hypothetical protein